MTKNKNLKNKKGKMKTILLFVLIILSGAFAALSSIILNNNEVAFTKKKPTEVINKVKNMLAKGEGFKLTQKHNKSVVKTDKQLPIAVKQKTLDGAKDKSIEEKKEIITNTNNETNRAKDKISDSDKKKALDKIRSEVEKSKQVTDEKEKNTKDVQVQAVNKRLALIKVQGELKVAYSQVELPKEKQVLSIMISAVGKLEANPSYNSKPDQAYAKSIYNKLDADSKNDIKLALFTNIYKPSIPELKASLGL